MLLVHFLFLIHQSSMLFILLYITQVSLSIKGKENNSFVKSAKYEHIFEQHDELVS